MKKNKKNSTKNSHDFRPPTDEELANAKLISRLLAEGKLGQGPLAKHVQYQLEGKSYYTKDRS